MSVVLAIKDKNRILVATDSQVSRGGVKSVLISPNLMKIWKPSGHTGLIMGLTGTLRDQNILSTRDTWYDTLLDKAGEPIDFKFVVREIVPEILNELTAHSRTTQSDSGITMGSQVLFAKDNVCYSIDFDGCVNELIVDGQAMALGSGSDIALAAYNVLQDIQEIDIKEKLIRAVSQACQDDLYVNYPIVIMDTSSENIELFDGETLYSMSDFDEDFNDGYEEETAE